MGRISDGSRRMSAAAAAAVTGVDVEATPSPAGCGDPTGTRAGGRACAHHRGGRGTWTHVPRPPVQTVGTDIVGPRGNRARTASPPPGRASIQTVPWSASTSWATIHMPSPVERFGPYDADFSKARGANSGGIPGPRSRTDISTDP